MRRTSYGPTYRSTRGPHEPKKSVNTEPVILKMVDTSQNSNHCNFTRMKSVKLCIPRDCREHENKTNMFTLIPDHLSDGKDDGESSSERQC